MKLWDELVKIIWKNLAHLTPCSSCSYLLTSLLLQGNCLQFLCGSIPNLMRIFFDRILYGIFSIFYVSLLTEERQHLCNILGDEGEKLWDGDEYIKSIMERHYGDGYKLKYVNLTALFCNMSCIERVSTCACHITWFWSLSPVVLLPCCSYILYVVYLSCRSRKIHLIVVSSCSTLRNSFWKMLLIISIPSG